MAEDFDEELGQDFSEVYVQAEETCDCGDHGVPMEEMTSDERWLLLTEALEALFASGWELMTFDTEIHPETVSLDLKATFAKTGSQPGEEDEEDDG